MHFLTFSTLLVCAFAAPQGYNLQVPTERRISSSPGISNEFGGSFSEETNKGSHSFGSAQYDIPQPRHNTPGQALHQEYNGPESQVFHQQFNTQSQVPQQQHTSPTQSRHHQQQFDDTASQGQYNAPGGVSQQQYNAPTQLCRQGEVLKVDGSCAKPIVTRNIFLYAAPEQKYEQPEAPELPPPKIDYNIIFVRTPDAPEELEPIVIPPPQQKTLVYVLSENGEVEEQRVIEVPAPPPHSPEVFYVNYNDGDNPHLIGGIDLQTALQSGNAQEGQSIGNGSNGGSSSSSGGISNGSSSQYGASSPQAPKQQYSVSSY